MTQKGTPTTGMMIRRQKVLRYALRGLTPDEMVGLRDLEGVSRATIFRDVAALKAELAEKVEAKNLYTVKRAFAELGEVYRELWLLFHRPPPATEKGPVDDRGLKAMLLNHIRGVIAERCRLAGFLTQATTPPELLTEQRTHITSASDEEELRRKVEAMTPEEEAIIIEAIRLLSATPSR
jgi:hypothetical protein